MPSTYTVTFLANGSANGVVSVPGVRNAGDKIVNVLYTGLEGGSVVVSGPPGLDVTSSFDPIAPAPGSLVIMPSGLPAALSSLSFMLFIATIETSLPI